MKRISPKQLERYPVYLKLLKEEQAQGNTTVSSPRLAAMLGYSEEQVRKDFQAISTSAGVPKKGRQIAQLIQDIESFLGYKHPKKAIVIGVGHMGGALMSFASFRDMGLEIVAGFDCDPKLIGQQIGGKEVYPMENLAQVVRRQDVAVAVITVPASFAQRAAELAFDAGVRGIWNFAPVVLNLPYGAMVENVNLASSLAVLSHRLDRINAKVK